MREHALTHPLRQHPLNQLHIGADGDCTELGRVLGQLPQELLQQLIVHCGCIVFAKEWQHSPKQPIFGVIRCYLGDFATR